ncbi:pseudouridine synthase, partial [Candidatus Dependentiae bacterium]
MPLAKFISRAGVCSRRKAVEKVRKDLVFINGYVCSNPAQHVCETDEISCGGKTLKLPGKKHYILLNKPSGYLTAASNEFGKKTVMELVKGVCNDRIYPVGRLDCMTTGLLLFTNDGDLTQRLTHPSFNIPKIYEATLNKQFSLRHMKMLSKGLQLDDGPIRVDKAFYPVMDEFNKVSVEIHSGRYRIVRRIFECLGYKVKALDRVGYAGFKKDDLKIGEFRVMDGDCVNTFKESSFTST